MQKNSLKIRVFNFCRIDGKAKTDDPHFNYNMTILIGCSAEVTTRDGEVYEGIYVAFGNGREGAMEILLEAAHLVTDNQDDSSIEKHFDVLVIPSEKVSPVLSFKNYHDFYDGRVEVSFPKYKVDFDLHQIQQIR